jgi:hypothetical protein
MLGGSGERAGRAIVPNTRMQPGRLRRASSCVFYHFLVQRAGFMEIPIAIQEAVKEPQQVTSRSLPDQLIATTYVLEEENGGTRVTVSMTGFEALPADAREDRMKPSGTAWEKALANLNASVAGTELPFPQGYVAALLTVLAGLHVYGERTNPGTSAADLRRAG